jgi:hypothetical protein
MLCFQIYRKIAGGNSLISDVSEYAVQQLEIIIQLEERKIFQLGPEKMTIHRAQKV